VFPLGSPIKGVKPTNGALKEIRREPNAYVTVNPGLNALNQVFATHPARDESRHGVEQHFRLLVALASGHSALKAPAKTKALVSIVTLLQAHAPRGVSGEVLNRVLA